MPTTSLRIKYRPIRIGFLVQSGDLNALRQIAGVCSIIWGGIYNPILPIGRGREFIDKTIKYFNVDVLTSLGTTSGDITAIMESHEFLRTPTHFGDQIFFEDWETKKQDVGLWDITQIIDHYWETEFKHKPPEFKSRCVLIGWEQDDPAAYPLSISFGHFTGLDNLKDDYRFAFEKGLMARAVSIQRNGPIVPELSELVCPLALTSDRLQQSRAWSFHERGGLYVGGSSDFDDLVEFWNLRATGAAIQYLPYDQNDRYRDFVQAYLNRLDSETERFPASAWIGVYYKEEARGIVEPLVNTYTTRKPRRYIQVNPSILHLASSQFHHNDQEVLASVDREFERHVISFSLPPKPTVLQDDHSYKSYQNLVAVVNTGVEFSYPGYTLNPPPIRSLNEFLSRAITFDPWKLRVERDGIAIIVQKYDHSERLFPISHNEILMRVFEDVGLKTEQSPAGILAGQIIQSMREARSLDACRVFKIRGVRKLLKTVRSGEKVSWDQAIQAIGKAGFDRYKELYIESRRTRKLTPQDAFTFLLKKNVFRPHLRFLPRLLRQRKEFRCRRCTLKEKILLQEFETSWRCPSCNHEQDLTSLVGVEFRTSKANWLFEKAGLFSKDNSQEGALPVILTLMQINMRMTMAKFLYSTALKLKSQRSCETDLVVLQYGRNGTIELGIGECKDEGGHITQIHVDNLRMVCDCFRTTGINCFLIFSKTADNFLPDELALFGHLRDEGMTPILLSNHELEPYDPYEERRDMKLPHPGPLTLEEMARNSEFIYLR